MTILDASTTLIITTRPAGHGAALCRALRRRGLRCGNLPAVRLAAAADPLLAQDALDAVMRTAIKVIFTSPAAVHYAHALASPWRGHGQLIAVGASTARALAAFAGDPVVTPARADSEGLLALPELRSPRGEVVAIVGADGGRQLLGETLQRRGANLLRANVYRRLPARLDARHWRLLRQPAQPYVVTVTSAQAIEALAARVPAAAWRRLLKGVAIASSPRLVALASELGFTRIEQADSATDADLKTAILARFSVP